MLWINLKGQPQLKFVDLKEKDPQKFRRHPYVERVGSDEDRQVNLHNQSLGCYVIEPIIFFELVFSFLKQKLVVDEHLVGLLSVLYGLFRFLLSQLSEFLPVLFRAEIFLAFEVHVHLPLGGLFFFHFLKVASLLLLERLLLHLLEFLLRHVALVDSCDLWSFFSLNSLRLYSCSFVLQLWNGKFETKLVLSLLENVVKGKLNHYLSKSRIIFSSDD